MPPAWPAPAGEKPKTFTALDYSHLSLTAQLDTGVWQPKIDVLADTRGGPSAHPYLEMAGTVEEANPGGVMDKPGLK